MIADYAKVYRTVYMVLQEYASERIPISLKYITSRVDGLRICSYSDAIKNKGCTIQEWCDFLDSDLGAYACDHNKGRYVVYYNDTIFYEELDRFTIAHELGHHFLEHHRFLYGHSGILQRGFSKPEYEEIEKEANCFARNLLAPYPILKGIGISSTDYRSIQNVFNISKLASKVRSGFCFTDSNAVKWPTPLYKKYKQDVLRCRNLYTCKRCKHIFSIPNAQYCPICGGQNLILWGEQQDMKYDGIKVDTRGKAIICPVCNNEETSIDGDFCQICGTDIVNHCKKFTDTQFGDGYSPCCDDAKTLPGNYRYCPYCGKKTAFFLQNLLDPWKPPIVTAFNEIEVDDTLPF